MKSNEDLIQELVNFGPAGAIQQVFIFTALRHYSETILDYDKEPENWPPLINWEAWRKSAEHIVKRLDEEGR